MKASMQPLIGGKLNHILPGQWQVVELAMCRLKVYGKKTIDDVHEALAGLPEGITAAFNLGHADVFPSTSGKENAAKYLMSKFDADPSSSFLLCDDDNDIGELPSTVIRMLSNPVLLSFQLLQSSICHWTTEHVSSLPWTDGVLECKRTYSRCV